MPGSDSDAESNRRVEKNGSGARGFTEVAGENGGGWVVRGVREIERGGDE